MKSSNVNWPYTRSVSHVFFRRENLKPNCVEARRCTAAEGVKCSRISEYKCAGLRGEFPSALVIRFVKTVGLISVIRTAYLTTCSRTLRRCRCCRQGVNAVLHLHQNFYVLPFLCLLFSSILFKNFLVLCTVN